jgi:tetratricopeptide (TPR) repeat protein
MKTAHPTEFNENSLNVMGYGLLQKGKAQDAISVFVLNLELFPDYANGYDSLGEAWLKIGDKQKARKAYEKAMKLDPSLSSSKKALEGLNKKGRG